MLSDIIKKLFGKRESLSVTTCKCGREMKSDEMIETFGICPECGKYLRLSPRERTAIITDEGSFEELFGELESKNILDFPGYDEKLQKSQKDSGEKEGVLCGTASIGGNDCAFFVMDPKFMMGSMGTVLGEKVTLLFEYATEKGLPVVGYTVSGGARMQEGILSLMQMAKTSGAVKRHSDKGNLYIPVLTDPTTGGVTASFAMEGDIILAEPEALIGFAGPRVIEQTIGEALPKGFQRAAFQLEHGFVDQVVERKDQKDVLAKLLSLHRKEAEV